MSPPAAYLDLEDLFRTLLRRAPLILGVAVLAGLLAAGAAARLVTYYAEATLRAATLEIDATKPLPYGEGKAAQIAFVRNVPPPEYKALAPRFDGPAFAEFAARHGGMDPQLKDSIERTLSSEQGRRSLISPLYGSTRSDVRELGESARWQENAVLGIRVSYASRDAERARSGAALVSEFVTETIFLSIVQDIVSARAREHEAGSLVAQNVLVNARFALARSQGSRHLASVSSARGSDSRLPDLGERVVAAERQARKASAQSDYYRNVEALVAAKPRPEALIGEMRKRVAEAFPEGADPDGAMVEARNEALLDLVQLTALRERGLTFIAAPALVEQEPPARKIGMAVFGGTLVVGLALVLTAVWWRSGRHSSPRRG